MGVRLVRARCHKPTKKYLNYVAQAQALKELMKGIIAEKEEPMQRGKGEAVSGERGLNG
jgi:23S rRNA maturation mini-RNase III